MIPFLSTIGYSVVQRGYILAGTAIVAILGQFLFGYLCDRFKKIRVFFFFAYVLLVIGSMGMFLMTQKIFLYHLMMVSLMSGMVKVIMGLDETWMLAIDSRNYGKLRAFGALGLTVGSPIAGYLVKQFSYCALLMMFVFVSVLMCCLIVRSKDMEKEERKRSLAKDIKQLLKNKQYMILVLIYFMVYMIGTADQYVVIDKMLSIGADNAQIGIKWALQSFMEVPLFLFASWILKKYKLHNLLMFGIVMYGVKFLLYGMAHSPWYIIGVAMLQLVTLPIIMLTSKVLIKEVSGNDVFNSAQMFAMAIFIGGSGLITPLITSRLSHLVGYDTTLYIVAGFSIVPLLLILYYRKLRNTFTST